VIQIEPFRPDLAPAASRTLAPAFAANPLHIAALGVGFWESELLMTRKTQR
jgi:hypothetical protein